MSTDFEITGLKDVQAALRAIANDVDKKKEIEKDFSRAVKPMIVSAKSMINQAEITVKRYSWKKRNYRKGTKDGEGKVVAEYLPGNLRNSIKVIKTKSKNPLIHIGAKAGGKKAKSGVYGSGRVDGWYAHMIHEGTRYITKSNPFLKKAYQQQKATVENNIGEFLRKKIKREAKKRGLEVK